jgi:hypothetical protein
MSVGKLSIVCSVETSHFSLSSIDPYLLENFRRNIDLCGPILKVRERGRTLQSQSSDFRSTEVHKDVVCLVHQSAKEFLLSSILLESIPKLSIRPPKETGPRLAITCLSYLAFDDFAKFNRQSHSGYRRNLRFFIKSLLHENHFLDIAAKSWVHFEQEDQCNPDIWVSFHRLAQSGDNLILAFDI